MRSVNRFTVHGNIGSITPFEKSLKINVATNRFWNDENGTRKESTDWVQVTILDERQVSWLREKATVGDVVFAEGRIANSSYSRNGETIYSTDLIASIINIFPKVA